MRILFIGLRYSLFPTNKPKGWVLKDLGSFQNGSSKGRIADIVNRVKHL